jgi:hypothetical protein
MFTIVPSNKGSHINTMENERILFSVGMIFQLFQEQRLGSVRSLEYNSWRELQSEEILNGEPSLLVQ